MSHLLLQTSRGLYLRLTLTLAWTTQRIDAEATGATLLRETREVERGAPQHATRTLWFLHAVWIDTVIPNLGMQIRAILAFVKSGDC